MGEYRRRLILEALITAEHEHTADAVMGQMRKGLEEKLEEFDIRGEHTITGPYLGTFSIQEKPSKVRGPRKKPEGKKRGGT